jgi:uncharacterized protein YyaL (SSP411 family)
MPGSRLADSASTYLRQHAADPVDWRPWGDEAFAEAARRDVPVLLSCGYAACHWCHVMQRESFRDPETAALINDRFVAVKVDREERPDVDTLYMDYLTATTGHGGWPMTVFLTPARAPVFGGTYLPKRAPAGSVSFTDVLESVDEAWRSDRARLLEAEARSLEFLSAQASPKHTAPLERAALDASAEYVALYSDPVSGGFGSAPKFPQWPLFEFLVAYHGLFPDPEIDWVVSHGLLSIVRGGIYDQVGGGVMRYAVGSDWLVPHFEKMLYDQAMLLSSLAKAASLLPDDTARAEAAHVAAQTIAFLLREMALPAAPREPAGASDAPAGSAGFAASLSAETDGVEGATYVWRWSELQDALDADDLDLAQARLGADRDGTWEGSSIITRRAGRSGDAPVDAAVDALLAKLLAVRARRSQPEADTKVVVSWNAMLARGLLEAGEAFGLAGARATGLALTRVLLARAIVADGVPHVLDDPAVSGVRLAEDAAHLAAAALAAHAATGDPALLQAAREIQSQAVARFADGYDLYMTSADGDLPVRPRESGDQPAPSGASTLVENAVSLLALTGDEGYRDFIEGALPTFWAAADFAPETAGRALAAACRYALLP